jgi:two-component system chemotaxis response regulator CheY
MSGALQPNETAAASRTILVVDDAGMVRRRCSQLLTGLGCRVVEAQNGLEALAAYEREKPDVVLLDITMPEMDGLLALKELLKLDADARVVMVTGLAEQSIVLDALRAGAKDFVSKPFEPERLLAAIEKALS